VNTLSRKRAHWLRRTAQMLSAPWATSILGVIEHIGGLQIDPTNMRRARSTILNSSL
jgi:hypothetical protein